MKFTELESIMAKRGVNSLASIARTLNTTPQAVSNWKSRDQVPYHIVAKLNQTITNKPSKSTFPHEDTISLSDILLIISEQLKVILIVPILTVFLTFTYVFIYQQPSYISSAKLLFPRNQANSGGLTGLTSQFGMNISASASPDLSSPSLLMELVNSRRFAERILNEMFYTKQSGQELSLLEILTHGTTKTTIEHDNLIQMAIIPFQNMVTFKNEGSFSIMSVRASEPLLARDINVKVLEELLNLNRYFKSQTINEKINFIETRIKTVGVELESLEEGLKLFREQNRQVSSPALQLQQERLKRDVEIQKGIYLTLKQQLELASIERIQQETIVQILDKPLIPLNASGRNLKTSVLFAGVFGLGFGILLGFFRSYFKNSDTHERKKLRRVINFLKKKGKDLIMDRRVSGLISAILLICLPFYLGHRSQDPIFFGMYSSKLMLFITVYVLTLLFLLGLFIHLNRKKN